MRHQVPIQAFSDDRFLMELWLSEFGHLLRAHTNFCMVKFVMSYQDMNNWTITYT